METLVQLGQQYKGEFEERYEGIRKRSAEQIQLAQDTVQQIQPELESKQHEFVALVQDTKPVGEGYAKVVLEIFAWTAVLVFTTNMTALATGYLLAPVIGLFIGSAMAVLLAYVVLPALVVFNADYSLSDVDIRFRLVAFAIAEGILTGFLFSERYLSTMQPVASITPLVIALVGALVEGNVGTERVLILGTTIGAGAAIHLLVGLIFHQLSFTYFLMVLFYSIAGLAAEQVLFKDTDFSYIYSSGRGYAIMFGYFVAALYIKLVVFAVFGGQKPANAGLSGYDESMPL